MAINILSIPSISVKAERVFLGTRRTVSWDRISLRSTNIKHTECLKIWLLSNITARGGLMATSVMEKAFNILVNRGGGAQRATANYTKPKIIKLTIVVRVEVRGQLYFRALPRPKAIRSLTTTTLLCRDFI